MSKQTLKCEADMNVPTGIKGRIGYCITLQLFLVRKQGQFGEFWYIPTLNFGSTMATFPNKTIFEIY